MHTDDYKRYLVKEKKVSENTVTAYIRDIEQFERFIVGRGIASLEKAENADVVAYLMELKSGSRSRATVNRKLASVRTYYSYLLNSEIIRSNPADNIKSPRIEKKEIEYLSVEDIDMLLSLPDESVKGMRDRAILELLYATGIRASELIDMKLEDCNMRMGFVKCDGPHSKARIIPMGRPCRKAMEDYIYESRNMIIKEKQTEFLFVNYMGDQMTRQGLWKVLKEYGDKMELKVKLTPQVIRNSFAVHMLQNGADLKSLQELMGHEDIAATQVYLSVTKNRIKDVYDRTHPRA